MSREIFDINQDKWVAYDPEHDNWKDALLLRDIITGIELRCLPNYQVSWIKNHKEVFWAPPELDSVVNLLHPSNKKYVNSKPKN